MKEIFLLVHIASATFPNFSLRTEAGCSVFPSLCKFPKSMMAGHTMRPCSPNSRKTNLTPTFDKYGNEDERTRQYCRVKEVCAKVTRQYVDLFGLPDTCNGMPTKDNKGNYQQRYCCVPIPLYLDYVTRRPRVQNDPAAQFDHGDGTVPRYTPLQYIPWSPFLMFANNKSDFYGLPILPPLVDPRGFTPLPRRDDAGTVIANEYYEPRRERYPPRGMSYTDDWQSPTMMKINPLATHQCSFKYIFGHPALKFPLVQEDLPRWHPRYGHGTPDGSGNRVGWGNKHKYYGEGKTAGKTLDWGKGLLRFKDIAPGYVKPTDPRFYIEEEDGPLQFIDLSALSDLNDDSHPFKLMTFHKSTFETGTACGDGDDQIPGQTCEYWYTEERNENPNFDAAGNPQAPLNRAYSQAEQDDFVNQEPFHEAYAWRNKADSMGHNDNLDNSGALITFNNAWANDDLCPVETEIKCFWCTLSFIPDISGLADEVLTIGEAIRSSLQAGTVNPFE